MMNGHRETFKARKISAEALAAWEEYQTTGQHVTAQEADAWLAHLEAGEDAAPPIAHE